MCVYTFSTAASLFHLLCKKVIFFVPLRSLVVYDDVILILHYNDEMMVTMIIIMKTCAYVLVSD